MGEKTLRNYFESFLARSSIFTNKKALQSFFVPGSVKHRDKEISLIAGTLAPALRMEKPSNLFVYGKTGTGKTLTVKHTLNQMQEIASQKDLPLKIIYMNCKLKKIADTEYRLVAQLAREFGKDIPPTGLPTDEVYKIFYNAIDANPATILIILDEIDQLVKKAGDEILYNFTRINGDLKNAHVTIIGISNDLLFADNLDPRIKSSLSEEEIVFPPYNAFQLRSILKERSKLAFKESTLDEGVLEKCAAYAAREHGDARRALELLRVAGEVAEREEEEKVQMKHLDHAEKKIERDRFFDIVVSQPKHHKIVLCASLTLAQSTKKAMFTGDVYDLYRKLCTKTQMQALTQRRVSDVISELDMLGIIHAKIISKGRYGRTREIGIGIPKTLQDKLLATLKEALSL